MSHLGESNARAKGCYFIMPDIAAEVQELVRPVAALGLPASLGDWFEAVQTVQGVVVRGRSGAVIGGSPFGMIVVQQPTGEVVYCDEDGGSQLINSSIEAFLAFAVEWCEAVSEGFVSIDQRRERLAEIDAAPFDDLEGIWSLMFEEAAGGLY